MDIYTIRNKKEEKILRAKAVAFDFTHFSKKEIRELIKTMRVMMHEFHGIGLAANQIGLNISVFVAQCENKFYAIFNPKIIKNEGGKNPLEEGCLSVPETYGTVPRYEKIVLAGQDQNGKKIKIKAWGLLAHIFQHETDHLNGALFIDKAKNLHTVERAEND